MYNRRNAKKRRTKNSFYLKKNCRIFSAQWATTIMHHANALNDIEITIVEIAMCWGKQYTVIVQVFRLEKVVTKAVSDQIRQLD